MPAIRVLIADDSPFVCRMLTTHLHATPGFQVVGTAMNGLRAVELVKQLKPAAVTLDLEMPEMDGLEALKLIMRECPTPVIMLSGISREAAAITFEAIKLGAVDFILKYTPGVDTDPEVLRREIVAKVRAASKVKVIRSLAAEDGTNPTDPVSVVSCLVATGARSSAGSSQKADNHRHRVGGDCLTRSPDRDYGHLFNKSAPSVVAARDIVVIGASTGGPTAVQELLQQLPANFAVPILIVQHMPAAFTRVLAAQLDQQVALHVREAQSGDRLEAGTVYITPGDRHLLLNNDLTVDVRDGPKIAGHRPSIDVTMQSVAQLCGARTIGVLLTGMGEDGAAGMSLIHAKRGKTYAQSEESCVVFGMPQRAIQLGSINTVASPEAIGKLLQAESEAISNRRANSSTMQDERRFLSNRRQSPPGSPFILPPELFGQPTRGDNRGRRASDKVS